MFYWTLYAVQINILYGLTRQFHESSLFICFYDTTRARSYPYIVRPNGKCIVSEITVRTNGLKGKCSSDWLLINQSVGCQALIFMIAMIKRFWGSILTTWGEDRWLKDHFVRKRIRLSRSPDRTAGGGIFPLFYTCGSGRGGGGGILRCSLYLHLSKNHPFPPLANYAKIIDPRAPGGSI